VKSGEIKYSGILLAAGNSSRMNKWKMEVVVNELPILFHSLKKLLTVCEEIILVGGKNFDKLNELIQKYPNETGKPIRVILNKNYEQGMFSSIKAGVESAGNDSIFIALADMPFVKDETYQKLKTSFESRNDFDYIQPALMREDGKQKKGHPILMNTYISTAIKGESPHATLRDVLKKFKCEVLSTTDEGVVFDIDTPEDLLKAEKLFLK